MLFNANKGFSGRSFHVGKARRGDTIIEVIFAVTVFCLVSVLTITMMNHGLATGTASMELTLARQEMDAQAEAIRFIHDAYEVERNLPDNEQLQIYAGLWREIKSKTVPTVPEYETDVQTCTTNRFDPRSEDFNHGEKQFALNARVIDPTNIAETIISPRASIVDGKPIFKTTQLFPRLVYGDEFGYEERGTDTNEIDDAVIPVIEDGEIKTLSSMKTKVIRVEGLWVQAVQTRGSRVIDFHIRSCWMAPGQSVVSTLGTIIRVYDPDMIE